MSKKIIFIALSLLVIGLLIFVIVMSVNGWNFKALGTVKYSQISHTALYEFTSIEINEDTADIEFALSSDDRCIVDCYEDLKMKHSVFVEQGTLKINVINEKKWYDYIGFSFETPKITIYLPQKEYDSLVIDTSTGDIDIPKDFTFNSVDISISTGDICVLGAVKDTLKIEGSTGDITIDNEDIGSVYTSLSTGDVKISSLKNSNDVNVNVSTGDISLNNIYCESLNTTGSTGSVNLTNVIALNELNIERSTGDITLNRCDSREMHIKATTGDITVKLISSNKTFNISSTTGDINAPQGIFGSELCEIETSTGDIKVSAEE